MSTLKPFDLKLAAAGHPIQTRDGEPAKFLAFADDCNSYKVVASISQEIETFTSEGRCYLGSVESDRDLFMAPMTHERWINLYDESAYTYMTREEADMKAREGRIACIKVTFTEGEGL